MAADEFCDLFLTDRCHALRKIKIVSPKTEALEKGFTGGSKRRAKVHYFASQHFLQKFQANIWPKCLAFYFCPAFRGTTVDLVAQPVEHLTFNQVVLGSNPSGITFKNPRPAWSGIFCFRIGFLNPKSLFKKENQASHCARKRLLRPQFLRKLPRARRFQKPFFRFSRAIIFPTKGTDVDHFGGNPKKAKPALFRRFAFKKPLFRCLLKT